MQDCRLRVFLMCSLRHNAGIDDDDYDDISDYKPARQSKIESRYSVTYGHNTQYETEV